MKSNKSGFTLMEMIIVIAIIGVLLATGLSISTKEYDKQKKNIMDVLNGIDTYNVWLDGKIIETFSEMPTLDDYTIININTHDNICDIEVKEKENDQ